MDFPPRISTPTGKKAIYYYSEASIYRPHQYFVKDLPIGNIIDIAFAYLDVLASGEVIVRDRWATLDNPFTDGPYKGNGIDPQNSFDSPPQDLGIFGQFKKLLLDQKKRFNLSLAIGGWEQSKFLSDAFSTLRTRSRFITSLLHILKDYPIFNGVIIDWEYVTENGENYGENGNVVTREDGKNFILMLEHLREVLGPNFTIAACCTGVPWKAKWPIEEAIKYLDELHLMTFDYNDGAWGDITAHHSNLYPSHYSKGLSAVEAVIEMQRRGVPAKKLFIAGALYSRGFANTDGIGKPAQGSSPNGSVAYKNLPIKGANEMWDPEARATYAYDHRRRIIDTYDNVASIREKANYIKNNNLGGIVLREASADVSYNNPRSIMRALHDHLTHGHH